MNKIINIYLMTFYRNGIFFFFKPKKKTMKCTSILLSSLITVAIALSSLPHPISSICMDFYDPMNLNNLSMVDCTPKKTDDNIPEDFQFDGSNLFQVIFSCEIKDQDLCDRVEKTFNVAGDIVTYALTLNRS